jgi:hypothetical protein
VSTSGIAGHSALGGATGGNAVGGTGAGGTTSTSTAAGGACSPGVPLSGGTQHCYKNDSGSYGPYQWSLWSNTNGSCLTTYSDGVFSASWDGSGDVMAGVGLVFDGTKTHQELGSFSADFAETSTGTTKGYSYIGVYADTVDPVATLYILDDSFQAPTKPWNSQLVGTLTVDGGTYDIYKGMTLSDGPKPSFINVYSIRQERRTCGHISVSAHLSKWEELGMKLGKLDRVEVHTESAGGKGSIDFSTVKVTLE